MDKEFLERVVSATKILTFQHHALRTREGSRLLSKARNSRKKKHGYPFAFLLLSLAAQVIEKEYYKYPNVKTA